MEMQNVVMVSACRTAIGKFQGALKNVSARELAVHVGIDAAARAGIDVESIDELVLAQCLPGMQGSLPARQVSKRIGFSDASSAVSINQNCGSGMRAVEIAAHSIMVGKNDIVMVVGAESMTNAPYLLPKARSGYRMGPGTIEDSLLTDALVDELAGGHMGTTAENVAEKYGITREECDELALMSHTRALDAIEAGHFKREITPFEIVTRKGTTVFDTDEHPIPNSTLESLGKLRPAFKKEGVVTAANASGINDGAAAAIFMSEAKAKELGIKPLMKLVNTACAGVDPLLMGLGPAVAIPKALNGTGYSFDDVEYWEINEAFAAQFLGVGRMLKEDYGMELSMDKTNHNGSGIALGHPVGCTALRIIVSLYYEMERLNLNVGGASLCVGTGPAIASLWTRDV
ncbi:acetyl-CoA acetyltransferase [Desulfoluna limicola]|uniref:Acetyl-CoA acetyltransferase n=2 Tax=Desulfoluna limicola TaxID=2810562 RepID=A0ABM7PB33_9BACT|nr:acetyl-CoA acetyltransferase [Desulfoluna limicola]